jgi:ABC-type Mn2+/Zn2+ transport system permease subunit
MSLIGASLSMAIEKIPTGPIIVVAGAAIFLVSLLFAPRRGAIARGLARLNFQRQLAAGAIELRETENVAAIPPELFSLERTPEGSAEGEAERIAAWSRSPSSTGLENSKSAAHVATPSPRWSAFTILQPIGVAVVTTVVVALWFRSLDPADRLLFGWTIVIGCLVSVPCAVLGCYLVLRRMSLLGDAIGHAVLPGIVLAFLASGEITGWPILVGAMAFGVLTAFLTHTLNDLGRVPEDSSLGIVYTTLFSLGVILVTRYAAGSHLDVECVLFGELDTIALEVPRVLPTMLGMCLVVLLFCGLLWKELKIASFDAGLATAMGISAGVVHYLLMAVVAGVTVTAFEAIGSILVVAMLIVPAATAHLLTDRLGPMIAYAIGVAILSAVFGQISAQWVNTNASAMMSVAAGLQFALAVFLAPQHGLVSKWWRNFSLSLRIAGEDVIGALYRAEEALSRGELTAAAAAVEGRGSVGGLAGLLAVPFLRRRGDIRVARGGELHLTDAGREFGRSIIRSHRLWETYLGEQTELPLDHLHEPAERMEHFIGQELQEQLAATVTAGDVDPHGREIPGKK